MTSNNKNKKMKRETADKLLEGVKERIYKVNHNPSYCYSITEAKVFGSYVNSDKDMLSDLDIAIRLEPKYGRDSQEFRDKREECLSMDYLIYYDWPRQDVLRFIRNRHPYISVHVLGWSEEEDDIINGDRTLELTV